MKRIVLLTLSWIAVLAHGSLAQVINGPSTATVGQTLDYTLNSGTIYSNELWSIMGGYVVTQSRSGTLYTVSVNWTSSGAGKVTFLSNYNPVAYKDVTVTGCSTPATPSTTLSATTASCGPRTLSYSGSPPSGVTWYWQTSPSGTSMSFPSTYAATTTGTYYLRAKANCGSVWSSSYKSIVVTVNPYPTAPSLPTMSGNTCGDKTLTRAALPAGVTWFWQDTNSAGTATTNSNLNYIANATGTYYIRAQDNATLCWSTTSAGVALTVTSRRGNVTHFYRRNWRSYAGTG